MGYSRTREISCDHRSVFSDIATILNRHYRKAVGGLVVYDVTKRSSLESAERWLKELKANAEPNINIILIGNKVDICNDDPTARQVTTEEGSKLAERHKLMFTETSAFQDINVRTAFEELLQSTFRIL